MRIAWLLLAIGLTSCYAAHERAGDAPLDAAVARDAPTCEGAPAACSGETVVDLRTLACGACTRFDMHGTGPDRIGISSGCAPGGRLRIVRCGATIDALMTFTVASSASGDSAGGYFMVNPQTCMCGGFTINFDVGHTETVPLAGTDTDEVAFVGAGVDYAIQICRSACR